MIVAMMMMMTHQMGALGRYRSFEACVVESIQQACTRHEADNKCELDWNWIGT